MTHPTPRNAHPGVQQAHLWVTLRSHPLLRAGQESFPDISQFQGQVDWDALGRAYQAGQIAGVMMRAGWGSSGVDSWFAVNQQGARSRGIPAMYYLFCYPAYNSPQAEADHFNALVGPLQANEAMCGDFEDDPQALPFPRGQAGLQWCEAFLTLLETPLNATWGYSYPSLISAVGLQPLWQTWPFWLADYSVTPDSVFTYAMARQYTDCGQVPGVSGCCDVSRVLKGPLSQWLTGGDMTLDQPTFNGLLANNPDFQALIWRVETIINGQATVPSGPTAGEVNAVAKLGQPTVDVNALASALAPHLPPAADPQAIATAVLQHLSKDTAAG